MINFPKRIITGMCKNKMMYSIGSFIGYSQKVYQKVSITRLPNQNYTLYIDTNDSVQYLFQHLKKLFPGSNFIAATKFQNKLGRKVAEEDVKTSQQIQKLETIQLLMHSNLMVYEHSNNQYNLSMGIQIKEYHQTNNRNLPEHIARNIIELSQQWRTDRSVENALSKVQIYDELEHKEFVQQKQELIKEARQSYANYLDLHKFYQKQFIDSGKARGLVANLIALMSINWVFLFAVTYGKYGWDVGEPLSYLTNLAVQLIAMMGIFSMDQTIEKTGRQDFTSVALRMNLSSLLSMKQFLISYSKRNY